MVEGTGLENRHTGNGIESSNLSLSVSYELAEKTELAEKYGNQETRKPEPRRRTAGSGRVAEWFKAHAWKVCVR